MSVQKAIIDKLTTGLAPQHLEVVNESHMHRGGEGRESHFRVVVVCAKFRGLSRVDRQRLVNELLSEELRAGLHALSQKTFTPEEWKARGESAGAGSPPCAGAHKKP